MSLSLSFSAFPSLLFLILFLSSPSFFIAFCQCFPPVPSSFFFKIAVLMFLYLPFFDSNHITHQKQKWWVKCVVISPPKCGGENCIPQIWGLWADKAGQDHCRLATDFQETKERLTVTQSKLLDFIYLSCHRTASLRRVAETETLVQETQLRTLGMPQDATIGTCPIPCF